MNVIYIKGDINAGGPSPLWLGLSLSLAEIKENGEICLCYSFIHSK
jgi:hypothetical protein